MFHGPLQQWLSQSRYERQTEYAFYTRSKKNGQKIGLHVSNPQSRWFCIQGVRVHTLKGLQKDLKRDVWNMKINDKKCENLGHKKWRIIQRVIWQRVCVWKKWFVVTGKKIWLLSPIGWKVLESKKSFKWFWKSEMHCWTVIFFRCR